MRRPRRATPQAKPQTKPQAKPWSGRFSAPTNRAVEAFTASLPFDWRLAPYDLQGSLAWVKALAKAKVLSREEDEALSRGLRAVGEDLAAGRLPLTQDHEDIHMAIERRLTEQVGEVGGKLHTGRSRNDQVALDLRLYLREAIGDLTRGLVGLQRALVAKAKAHVDVVMPGYTHLQRAQPIRWAHHLLAYHEMLERDRDRLQDCARRASVLPLGSGAIAGTPYPVDLDYLAGLLGFRQVSRNSVDAVSDRDFLLEFAADASVLMMHLSRLSEELVMWATAEFQFVDLPEAYCTGSSQMPQKKNPDVPELIRAKAGRVYGALTALLTVMKGLPLAYNRDLQESQPPLFEIVDTVGPSLTLLAGLIAGLRVNADAMRRATEGGHLLATELADYLVERGLPFRQAHAVAGRICRHAEERKVPLTRLTLGDLRRFSRLFQTDVFSVLTLEGAVERRQGPGGTAKAAVLRRIREIEQGWR